MPYYPKNITGATGMANSTPVVIATDQTWPIFTVLNIPVNGQTGSNSSTISTIFNSVNGTAGATAVVAVGSGQFLHVTSIQFINLGNAANDVNLYFGSGSTSYLWMRFRISANAIFSHSFLTPQRAAAANSFLWFDQNAGGAKPAFCLSVQGFKSP